MAPAVHRFVPTEPVDQVVVLVVLAADYQILIRPPDVVEEPARLLGTNEGVDLDAPLGVAREVPLRDWVEPRRLPVQQPAWVRHHELAVEGREGEAERALDGVEVGVCHWRSVSGAWLSAVDEGRPVRDDGVITRPTPRTDSAMPFSYPTPVPCPWFSRIASALDGRGAARLGLVCVGAVLARGRRTVTSWIRAANLSGDYKPVYTTVAAAGKRADSVAARLSLAVVKPLVEHTSRLTFALDDTPTP